MTTVIVLYSALIACLAIAVNCRFYSYEAEPSEYDSLYDSLEAGKRELEEIEAEKRELEEIEAEKRELEELKLEERYLLCNTVYQCPNGKTKKKNSNNSPRPNGCGPEGLNIDRFLKKNCPALIDCCNAHDECYGRYGASRLQCDASFLACNARAPRLECKNTGVKLTGIVAFFGCSAFNKAQQSATICY